MSKIGEPADTNHHVCPRQSNATARDFSVWTKRSNALPLFSKTTKYTILISLNYCGLPMRSQFARSLTSSPLATGAAVCNAAARWNVEPTAFVSRCNILCKNLNLNHDTCNTIFVSCLPHRFSSVGLVLILCESRYTQHSNESSLIVFISIF